MNNYCIYKNTCLINGKIYIGQTCQDPERRWGKNGQKYKGCPYFYEAIQKYGWDNFEHNILFENLTKEQACIKEQELINCFNSMNREFGYNFTSGGEIFTLNEDARKKISISMIGNKNGLGHPCSEEKKTKISKSQKGRKLTKQHKEKLSIAATKRKVPCSEEKKGKTV